MNNLFGQFSQQASQQGIAGEAGIHALTGDGQIRIKVTWRPPEQSAELTKNFADVLTTVLGMMNVEVKSKIE